MGSGAGVEVGVTAEGVGEASGAGVGSGVEAVTGSGVGVGVGSVTSAGPASDILTVFGSLVVGCSCAGSAVGDGVG